MASASFFPLYPWTYPSDFLSTLPSWKSSDHREAVQWQSFQTFPLPFPLLSNLSLWLAPYLDMNKFRTLNPHQSSPWCVCQSVQSSIFGNFLKSSNSQVGFDVVGDLPFPRWSLAHRSPQAWSWRCSHRASCWWRSHPSICSSLENSASQHFFIPKRKTLFCERRSKIFTWRLSWMQCQCLWWRAHPWLRWPRPAWTTCRTGWAWWSSHPPPCPRTWRRGRTWSWALRHLQWFTSKQVKLEFKLTVMCRVRLLYLRSFNTQHRETIFVSVSPLLCF